MNKELLQTISESLIRLRFLVGNQFVKPLKEIERERGALPPGHIHLMGFLKNRGTPVSMTDMAAKTCVSKPNLTSMMDRLCAEGFVERSADQNDRRIVNVALTEKGMDFVEQHKAMIIEFAVSRLALLDDPELEKLKAALNDIADVVSIMAEKEAEKK